MYYASASEKEDREARMGLKICSFIKGGQEKPYWYIFEQKPEERIIVHFFETLHGLRSSILTIILHS